jgi:hypothetical protein
MNIYSSQVIEMYQEASNYAGSKYPCRCGAFLTIRKRPDHMGSLFNQKHEEYTKLNIIKHLNSKKHSVGY